MNVKAINRFIKFSILMLIFDYFQGLYYIFNIVLVSVSVSASVLVLNCHFRGHKITRVPNWIKTVLMLKTNKPSGFYTNDLIEEDDKNVYVERKMEYLSNNINISNNRLYAENFEAFRNSFEKTTLKSKEKPENDFNASRKDSKKKSKRGSYNENNFTNETVLSGKRSKFQNRTQSIDSAKYKGNNESLDKLLKIIRHSVKLIDKNYLKLKSSQIANDEWKLVASRVDFFLFLIATFVVFTTPFVLFGKFLFTVEGPLSDPNFAKNKCKI